MFDHVSIRLADRSASERFYRTTLSGLGIEPTHVDTDLIEWNDFSIVAADDEHPPTRHLHVAFVASTREHVQAFWRAGLNAGAMDDGEPGERPQYTQSYYGAFLRDPDGNSAEAVHHGDARRGGHIDHLWIRVRDAAAAEAFYAALARHTGLREGRRWDQGVQFRGAWATFSLVSDGRAVTEGLRMAFPAPDRETVREFHAAAVAAGGHSVGAPGAGEDRRGGYYAAFVLDADGTEVGSIFR
jgi:catechol 2,3-dioxygenase-like lactoylglutathione lyase family enzyme